MEGVVEVAGLRKTYGEVVAVDDVSFRIEPQTTFGLVGPNGAGKTTTVECIEGLRSPDRGEVRVFGMDPDRQRSQVYRWLGVQLQESSMYDNIRLDEALPLFASMYPESLPPDQLLEEFGLTDKAKTRYKKLSGGQKRKLLTAVALVGKPRLVILDEPTTGLDPQSRRSFWATLRRYRRDGLSILLTTHDLLEAEENCDRVAIIDHGRIVAMGSPAELMDEHDLGIQVTAALPEEGFDREALADHPGTTRVEVFEDRVYAYGKGEAFVPSVTQLFHDQGLRDLSSRRANLEDLYLILTGRGYQKEGEGTL